MSVRAQDLVLFAGGEALERYGVLVRRTTPNEDVPEIYVRSGTAPLFDEYGYVRLAAANTPRPSWLDLDADGVPESAVLPLAGAQTNLVEFNIPGGTPADWELQQLDAVTNLAGEYGLVIDPLDKYPVVVPANFLPDSWWVCDWRLPRFASTDGVARVFGRMYADANNVITWGKDASGNLYATVIANGTMKSVTLTKTFAAGAALYLGLRLYSGTLYLYADADADGSLTDDVQSVGSVPASTGASWTYYHGSDQAGANQAEGAGNVLIGVDGSVTAPITDRFNAGAGMAIENWANLHSDKLVLYGPHSTNGSTFTWKTAYGSVPAVTRNSVGTWIEWTGTVKTAAVDVLRNRQRLTTNDATNRRYTMVERGTTNSVTAPVDLSDAASWLSPSNASLGAAGTAPDGTSTALSLIENTATSQHYIQQKVTLAGCNDNALQTWSFFVKAEGRNFVFFRTTNKAALTQYSCFNVGAGTLGTCGHIRTWMRAYGGGYYKCFVTFDAGVGAGGGVFVFYLGQVNGAGAPSYKGDGVSGIRLWGVQFEKNEPIGTSYFPTGGGSRVADTFTTAIKAGKTTPQECNVLYEGKIEDLPNQGTERTVFNIGNSTTSRIRVYFDASTARIYIAHHNGTSEVTGYWTSTVALADYITLRLYISGAGAFAVGLAINGGAEDTTLDGAISTQALPGSWANNVVGFGDADQGLARFLMQSGAALTLAQLQALTDGDIACYASGQTSELATQAASSPTKGAAMPGIDGKGGAWGLANATAVVASSEGIPLPYDSALGTKVVKLTTGPAGSGVRRYLLGLPGELNGFSASARAGCVVGVYIPVSSEVTAAQVVLYGTDNAGSTTGDAAPVKGKWVWLWAARTWNAGATEAYFELRFADGATLVGADRVVYLALPTACAGTVPVVAVPNATEGSKAIAAETIYTGFPMPPGACGVYAKWTAWAPGGVLYIGTAADTGARLWVEQDTDGKVAVRYTDGTTTLEKIIDVVVTPGQEVRFLGVLTATGTIQAHLRVEGGTLTSSTVSSALALPSAWGALRLYLGSQGGSDPAAVHLLAAKVVRGSGYTLDEVEAVA